MPVNQSLFSLGIETCAGPHLLYLHRLPQGVCSNYLCSFALPFPSPATTSHLSSLYSLFSTSLCLSDPLQVTLYTSAWGDVLPICYSVSHSLTFQEVNDFPPLPCIKWMELFKAHEGDVVVWMVHNGQTCSRDAGVQISAVRADRGKSKRVLNTTLLRNIYMKWFPQWFLWELSCCLLVQLTSFSLHCLLCETCLSGIAIFIWGQKWKLPTDNEIHLFVTATHIYSNSQ